MQSTWCGKLRQGAAKYLSPELGYSTLPLGSCVLEGHISFVTAISLSPNNRLLASVSWNKTHLWNLETITPLGTAFQHRQDSRSAALSLDAKVLVTAGKNNSSVWDVHAILKEAGLEDLLPIGTNIAPKDKLKQKAIDDSGIQHTPRFSLSDKSFLEADATQCPGQFGSVDDLPPGFLPAWKPMSMCSSPMGSAHPQSSVNALLTRLSSLLHHFRPENGEAPELPQPSKSSVFHLHALLARFSSLIHSSPPENDAQDELQPPSMSSRSDPRVLLARLSSLFPRSQLNTDDEAEPRPTTPSSSRPDPLISRLSSLFRSQPHANEEIELTQHPSRLVSSKWLQCGTDRYALVVARGPQFEKAKRAYEQAQLHAQAQALSSHTQPADTSTSATPAPGTAAAQPPIQWWAQIVLFLCCASPSHANGH
ncbi:hypothetical protein P692DRAFT_201875073 [Suillus brevipes Sb2]|nr:hypothetical protein P692DRAFT_201875073 [Suillus brevipes Sb2]